VEGRGFYGFVSYISRPFFQTKLFNKKLLEISISGIPLQYGRMSKALSSSGSVSNGSSSFPEFIPYP